MKVHPLALRVRRAIFEKALVPKSGRVVVALSGGPDSVAITYLLNEVAATGDLVLAGAAHLNHQLRGSEADEDQRFCERLCDALDLPLQVGQADVRERAAREGRSLEDAARVARYAFLTDAAS